MNLPVFYLIIFSTLLAIGEVFCPDITGQPLVNGTLGGNINITWKVQNVTYARWLIHINNTKVENELLTMNKVNPKRNYTFGKTAARYHNNLRERSCAFYHYTGNSGGQVTGQVVLTVTNLKFKDSGRFVLLDGIDYIINSVTVLSVNATEEKNVSGGVCAGHIVGFEVGVILICVFTWLFV